MRYAECLAFLDDLGHELRGRVFGLEAISAILAALGHPERRYPTAIVAGTNGKGSTSAMLASILRAAGYRTGLYTSPHLVRVNERIRLQGQEISDDDFACAFTAIGDCVEELIGEKRLDQRPSFFEYLTAAALLHFARAKAECVVLEVGMGGRLDATNVTIPRVAIITNIALDHQDFLGHTLAAIAEEKAGVIKPGRPVISTCDDPEARAVIRRRCSELGAEFIPASSIAAVSNLRDPDGFCRFDLALERENIAGVALPLAGRFQVNNALAAAAAAWRLRAEGLRITPGAIHAGLAQAAWPGRLEVIQAQPLVVLDGAHNPSAARAIAAFARAHWSGRTLRLIYASMRDKDISTISETLFPLAREVYLVELSVPRAASASEMLAAANLEPGQAIVEPEPAEALRRAIQASAPEDVVLAAGSLFLVGALKQALAERGQAWAAAARSEALAGGR